MSQDKNTQRAFFSMAGNIQITQVTSSSDAPQGWMPVLCDWRQNETKYTLMIHQTLITQQYKWYRNKRSDLLTRILKFIREGILEMVSGNVRQRSKDDHRPRKTNCGQKKNVYSHNLFQYIKKTIHLHKPKHNNVMICKASSQNLNKQAVLRHMLLLQLFLKSLFSTLTAFLTSTLDQHCT